MIDAVEKVVRIDKDKEFQEPVKMKRCRRCHRLYPETLIVTVHGTIYCDGDGTNDCFNKIQNNGCRNGDCA